MASNVVRAAGLYTTGMKEMKCLTIRLATLVLLFICGICCTSGFADQGDLLQTFVNPQPSTYAGFAWSVAEVDNNVVVGAPNHITGVVGTGNVHVFDLNGNPLHSFHNPPSDEDDGFGFSVAGLGGNVLVGAPWDHGSGTNAGAVYLLSPSGQLLRGFLHCSGPPW